MRNSTRTGIWQTQMKWRRPSPNWPLTRESIPSWLRPPSWQAGARLRLMCVLLKSPGLSWIGDPENDPCNVIVVVGQLNIDTANTVTFSLVVGMLSPFHYAQYGDGGGLFSQVLLFGLGEGASNANLALRGNDGNALATDLNGEAVNGPLSVAIPDGGLTRPRSDGLGVLAAGSGTVVPQSPLSGVILFGGVVGLAGVGISPRLSAFVAPMEAGDNLNTGIAIANVSTEVITVRLQLCDEEVNLLATVTEDLPGLGHLAQFVNQFIWDSGIDFSNFRGLLKARAPQLMAATVIQTRTGEFATMPVAELPNDIGPATRSVDSQGAEPETFTLLLPNLEMAWIRSSARSCSSTPTQTMPFRAPSF